MFRTVLRPSLSIFSCRFLSQSSLLPYEIDRFNAARVRMEDWPDNTENIRERLTGLYSLIFHIVHMCYPLASLQQWRNDRRTSAWLVIPIEKAHVIPIAAELGRERNVSTCMKIILMICKDFRTIMPKRELRC